MEQTSQFAISGQGGMVYRLKKALYGLKQAPKAWYDETNSFLFVLASNDVLLIPISMPSLKMA